MCDRLLDPGVEHVMRTMQDVLKLFLQHPQQRQICTDVLMNRIQDTCVGSNTYRNAVTKANNEFMYEFIGLASFRFLFNDRTLYSRLPEEFAEFNFNEDIMTDLRHNQRIIHDWLRDQDPDNFQFLTANNVLAKLGIKDTLMKYIQFSRTIEGKARKGVVFDWHQKKAHEGSMWIHHFYLWQFFLSDFNYHSSLYWKGNIEFKNEENSPRTHVKRHQSKLYWRTNVPMINP